jgi:hypothetical protein
VRIPGTDRPAAWAVRVFDLGDSDIRVIKRGYRTTAAAVKGAIVTTVGVGMPFTDVKTALLQVATTAGFASNDKRKSEQLTAAIYSAPPVTNGSEETTKGES